MSFRRLTRAQVREIDRRATADYGIPSIVLMENAARSAADVAMQMLDGIDQPQVDIYCGRGNNGGDGYAMSRHLINRGVDVEIIQAEVGTGTADAQLNANILRQMGRIFLNLPKPGIPLDGRADLIIDALFGTGLTRPIQGDVAAAIELINASGKPVLAIDVPSGMDCDTGEPLGPCIRANRTVTFVLSKKGFDLPRAKDYTGFISIGDIGIPRELIDAVLDA